MEENKYNGHRKYSLFIGRWQPFHEGHKWLINKTLNKGKNVCIGIRDTEVSHKNPYSIEQRQEMIRRIYGDAVKTLIIPDIESVRIGRNVGYEIIQEDPPEDIGKISGTKIREGIETAVPQEIANYLSNLNSTLWFTGLPCSGKTTLADRIKEEIDNIGGYRTARLDGDNVRGKLNSDLGFSERDRYENLRRVSHMADWANKNGNLVLASFISPIDNIRSMVAANIENMKLIYVKSSLEECERRDVKGMYARARKGKIKNFTGIDAPFDPPENPAPDLVVDTENNDLETCVNQIIEHFKF